MKIVMNKEMIDSFEIIIRWRDKREVMMISKIHTEETVDVPQRGGPKKKPKCVADYNRAKSFIDMSDQLS
ncbi:hypothetical protein J6590_085857 [Homalodisca vitripennis]|nr:hypothetical protein J6590_085857 [Homalodisca vitripennis]